MSRDIEKESCHPMGHSLNACMLKWTGVKLGANNSIQVSRMGYRNPMSSAIMFSLSLSRKLDSGARAGSLTWGLDKELRAS